jgi:hypothetical protein
LTQTMRYQRVVLAALVVSAGMLAGVTCEGLGQKLVHNVNPCGTVLNCNPVEYDLLTTDFPDFSIDPTCTIPGQCGTVWPLVGGTTTNTTTNTNTNTTTTKAIR